MDAASISVGFRVLGFITLLRVWEVILDSIAESSKIHRGSGFNVRIVSL